MAHVTPFVFGRFPGRRLNLFNGLWAQATCVDDWNADNFDHSGPRLHRRRAAHRAPGAAADRARRRAAAARRAALGLGLEGAGCARNAPVDRLHQRAGREPRPTRTTCSTSTRWRATPTACRVVRVTHARARERAPRRARSWSSGCASGCEAAGASETWHDAGARSVEARHCYGGTRMGDDPGDLGRRSLRLRARGAEPRDPRRLDVFPTTGGAQPDADAAGARLAHGDAPGRRPPRCALIGGVGSGMPRPPSTIMLWPVT